MEESESDDDEEEGGERGGEGEGGERGRGDMGVHMLQSRLTVAKYSFPVCDSHD